MPPAMAKEWIIVGSIKEESVAPNNKLYREYTCFIFASYDQCPPLRRRACSPQDLSSFLFFFSSIFELYVTKCASSFASLCEMHASYLYEIKWRAVLNWKKKLSPSFKVIVGWCVWTNINIFNTDKHIQTHTCTYVH